MKKTKPIKDKNMIDDDYLREYFTNATDSSKYAYWQPRYMRDLEAWKEFEDIINEISDNEKVLDVGCGYHPFKGKIKNLLGIDKYNSAADIVIDLMDFDAKIEDYDVILVLGSVHFHNFELVEKQIERILSWCKPGGRLYMRVNPQIEKILSPKQASYAWTIEDIDYFTKKHNLKIIKPVQMITDERYIFTWQK